MGSEPFAPDRDCPLCPRLADYRQLARAREPSWHNAPVQSFGDPHAALLIVGLAPGISGANRTGRPFTGDWAGDLLYATLADFGFARGNYARTADDGLTLNNCMITNAVRCVPPANKPAPFEISTCRSFLQQTIAGLDRLRAIVALGRIAHDSVVRALGTKPSRVPFGHGEVVSLDDQGNRIIKVFDSYHCSRYNTNTRVLTTDMFRNVFEKVRQFVDSHDSHKIDRVSYRPDDG